MNKGNILESRIRFDPPKDGSNLAKELRDSLKKHSDRTLIVDGKRKTQWTGERILDKSDRIATNLIKNPLIEFKEGQVVLTLCNHNDHEILLVFGVIFAGGAIYGSSPDDTYEEELEYCQMVRPSVIVCQSNLHQMCRKLIQNVQGMQSTRIIWIDNPFIGHSDDDNNNSDSNNNNSDCSYLKKLLQEDRVVLFDDLINGPRDESLIEDVIENKIDPINQNVTFLLTSGSTGKPKVVPNTHEELVYGIYSMLSCLKYPVGSNDSKLNGYNRDKNNNNNNKILLPLNEDSIIAGDLPLDHGAGLNTMFLSIVVGCKLIILPSYEEDSFWQGVNDFGITISIASTTFAYKLLFRLKQLIDNDGFDVVSNRWNLDSLKFISCAGSKLASESLINQINNNYYPSLSIGQCYGCTEIGFISMASPDDCRNHPASVGHLFPGLRAKVLDRDTGKLLSCNEKGELYLSTKSKFKGYKCLPGDDALKLYSQCHDEQGIYYKTGDLVHYDEEERIYIHGRIKDTLFLMQDWKILPVELEEVIDQHPLVELSAVVGVPDPDLPGCDAPKAFVKLISLSSKRFSQLDSRELKDKLTKLDKEFICKSVYDFVAKRTAKPKHLKGGIRIVDEFPRNGLLQKIDRKVLKSMD